jgi:hypothetical protein
MFRGPLSPDRFNTRRMPRFRCPPTLRSSITYPHLEARREPSQKQLATHRIQALGKVRTWFNGPAESCGGILVLPTGSRKT